MPTKLPRMTEAEFTTQVLAYADLRGWRTAHFRAVRLKDGSWRTPVQGDGKGFPDLILLRGAREVVAELKVPPNTTTPEQDEWLQAYKDAGRETYIWTPADWGVIDRVLA